MSHILIVEDEAEIASFLAKGLTADGYTTTAVNSGTSALAIMQQVHPDLVILDIGLPDTDGFTVLQHMRSAGLETPVIILTARSSVNDTVSGLQSGADDYMSKPFSFEELRARIQLRLKKDTTTTTSDLSHGDLRLDVRNRTATVEGATVELTAREYSLVEVFLLNPGRVLSRDELLEAVWGHNVDAGSNVVEVYMRYLRRKLGSDRFVTVRGVGYRLK
ncbi:response regulator transcription factor [Propioniferax innocua]|uniref:DNA-binding response OmpR family regulator n=1 Tax=Propioniferax innocua TaxID=1753 RepID=A0A542ZPF5_9ACTN|nr:response regulator transcription factor [Propioniferax innocua]TQL62232.1 DNA-binding response OmpR family regulator [Propioniferax innocua]